jgi:hypothetical protein
MRIVGAALKFLHTNTAGFAMRSTRVHFLIALVVVVSIKLRKIADVIQIDEAPI